MNIFKNKVFLGAAVVIVAGGGYWYWSSVHKASLPPQYVTTKVQRGTIAVSVTGSGQISASNQINVQPQISGTITAVPVKNNQNVVAGDILFSLDTISDVRAVQKAEENLQGAELALQTLEQPATASSILQAQQALLQAQQALQISQNNPARDYESAYTDLSSVFLDITGVMTGLNKVLYGTTVSTPQTNIDAYANLIRAYYPNASEDKQNVIASYQTALTAYNKNFANYKNSNVYASTSTIESLLGETYATLRAVSVANGNAKNLLDTVQNYLQSYSQEIPPQVPADVSNMQSYIKTVNGHLAAITKIQNLIQTDKRAITVSALALSQTEAALTQLKNGPTQLAIQTQHLAITQAKNALAQAKQNLAYDYIRAPFSGVITNVTAKVGQPVSRADILAILLGNKKIAKATLNEVDIADVKIGQKAEITFDALPDTTLKGKVSQIDALGTVVQGVVSFVAYVTLDEGDPSVKAGMTDNVTITTKEKSGVLFVPNSAILNQQDGTYIEVIGADGKPYMTKVEKGIANERSTEIVSGLHEGDTIVTQPNTETDAQGNSPQLPGLDSATQTGLPPAESAI